MSVRFIAVNWNRQKRIYDGVLGLGGLLTLGTFVGVTLAAHRSATAETALIRGLGLTALLLLHVILAIGPLARLDDRFLPLLYNRRHLGVTMAVLALAHAGFATFQFHGFGDLNPIVSVFVSNGLLSFELFGAIALVVMLLMAATSHDFWLSILTPPTWKRLHMLVYVAYGSLAAHVGWGALQAERGAAPALAFGLGALLIGGLHLAAAFRTAPGDRPQAATGWVDLGRAAAIPEGRAVTGMVAGERVAVFRHQDRLSCVSNVCAHQNGPLGEGRIVDGCITCPWHGYQYRPADGRSPPPFDDVIPTFNLRIDRGRVLVDPRPNAPGTLVEPVPAPTADPAEEREFYVGYAPKAPPGTAAFDRRLVAGLLLAGVTAAAVLALAQEFDPAAFDFGDPSTVTGVLRMTPYPVLEVPRPGADASVSRYILAGFGKHGAGELARGMDGRTVTVSGPLAYRSHLTLLEIAELTPAGDRTAPAMEPVETLGSFDLVGEIVDSKCYIGVMNPGSGTTHRGCAVRCLSGGLPPLFVVEDDAGNRLELLLVKPDGSPFDGLQPWAGRTIAASGRVDRHGDLWLLRADPDSFRELR